MQGLGTAWGDAEHQQLGLVLAFSQAGSSGAGSVLCYQFLDVCKNRGFLKLRNVCIIFSFRGKKDVGNNFYY